MEHHKDPQKEIVFNKGEYLFRHIVPVRSILGHHPDIDHLDIHSHLPRFPFPKPPHTPRNNLHNHIHFQQRRLNFSQQPFRLWCSRLGSPINYPALHRSPILPQYLNPHCLEARILPPGNIPNHCKN